MLAAAPAAAGMRVEVAHSCAPLSFSSPPCRFLFPLFTEFSGVFLPLHTRLFCWCHLESVFAHVRVEFSGAFAQKVCKLDKKLTLNVTVSSVCLIGSGITESPESLYPEQWCWEQLSQVFNLLVVTHAVC